MAIPVPSNDAESSDVDIEEPKLSAEIIPIQDASPNHTVSSGSIRKENQRITNIKQDKKRTIRKTSNNKSLVDGKTLKNTNRSSAAFNRDLEYYQKLELSESTLIPDFEDSTSQGSTSQGITKSGKSRSSK